MFRKSLHTSKGWGWNGRIRDWFSAFLIDKNYLRMKPTEINEASSRTERNSLITTGGENLFSSQPREFSRGLEIVSFHSSIRPMHPETDAVRQNEMNVVEIRVKCLAVCGRANVSLSWIVTRKIPYAKTRKIPFYTNTNKANFIDRILCTVFFLRGIKHKRAKKQEIYQNKYIKGSVH